MSTTTLQKLADDTQSIIKPQGRRPSNGRLIISLAAASAILLTAGLLTYLSAHGVSLGPLNTFHAIPSGGGFAMDGGAVALIVTDLVLIYRDRKKSKEFSNNFREEIDEKLKNLGGEIIPVIQKRFNGMLPGHTLIIKDQFFGTWESGAPVTFILHKDTQNTIKIC